MTKGHVRAAARLIRAARAAYARKWSFLACFALAFLASFGVLWQLGLTPDGARAAAAAPPPPASAAAVSAQAPELPVKIAIPSIGLSASIADPSTTDIDALDALLLKGAVRYPTSGLLGEENANVVIFGHSSYLPVVGNPAYKTFDGIQKLAAGATITVYSSDRAYTYAVTSVAKESAAAGDGIPLTVSGEVLTLATCDSFATPSDRFVVTASFVESHPLAS
ncbi:MAG TPA: sortase [Candidatus Paceibacterota bacterium]|nr:sortase [Candidatus Paceibacterota bacterium]